MLADLRIPGRECGGRSVCRFKDSGKGGAVFADLRILGRRCGGGGVGGFMDSRWFVYGFVWIMHGKCMDDYRVYAWMSMDDTGGGEMKGEGGAGGLSLFTLCC